MVSTFKTAVGKERIHHDNVSLQRKMKQLAENLFKRLEELQQHIHLKMGVNFQNSSIP